MAITQADKINFINKLSEHTIKGWKEYQILPSLTIAQAILETGWGTSNKIPNNLFGIKADSSWRGKKELVRTHEYVNGKKIYVDAYFRVYDSVYDSLKDRYTFLQKPRYRAVVGERDYKKACNEIWKAGYATDPNYPIKLIQIIEQNKLYEIDKKAMNITSSQSASPWAKQAWDWCVAKKYMDGNRPKDSLTREEMSVLLKRIYLRQKLLYKDLEMLVDLQLKI